MRGVSKFNLHTHSFATAVRCLIKCVLFFSTMDGKNSVQTSPSTAAASLGVKPPPLTPKPVLNGSVEKLSNAKLKALVESQARQIEALLSDASERDSMIVKMEARISKLEADQNILQSLLVVKDRVSALLSQRVLQLEQYTRRPSVIVKGIERSKNEKHPQLREEIGKLIDECDSDVSMIDVDKFHRNGPRYGSEQEIIIRFKSHDAKEKFYKKRKTIKRVKDKVIKIQPALSSASKSLLESAKETIKAYQTEASPNPPDFVLPDVHGNMLVKMSEETNDGLFLPFHSIEQLIWVITKYNSHQDASTEYDNIMGRWD